MEVVADLHLRPYYGDEDDTDGLYHFQVKRGTTAFHAYATLYARVKDKRYTQSVRRLEDGNTASSVLAEFLGLLDGLDVEVKAAYLDREFCDSKCLTLVVPLAPYNPRSTDNPLYIEYRVEDRINEHSKDVKLNQLTLDEMYNRRTGVERTNDALKDCGLGHVSARSRVHAQARVFMYSLCLRLVTASTNYERGDNPRSTIITV